MQCPDCGATDVIRAAMEWEKNTNVSVRTGGLGQGRRVGPLQQSLSAYRLAPPDEPRARTGAAVLLIALGWGAALWIWASGSGLAHPAAMAVATLALVAPLVWCATDAVRRRGRYVAAMQSWNALWFCRRCGHLADDAAFRTGLRDAGTAILPDARESQQRLNDAGWGTRTRT